MIDFYLHLYVMLTRQLRELEADQIVVRAVFPEVPPKVEYSLTDFGKTLEPILTVLQKWGTQYLDEITGIRMANASGAGTNNLEAAIQIASG